MSCGVSIQHARLLSDILEDVTPVKNILSECNDDDEQSWFDSVGKATAKKLIPNDVDDVSSEFATPSLPLRGMSQSLSSSSLSMISPSSYDPDTESDEREFSDSYDTPSPSSLTSVSGSDDDEGTDQQSKRSDESLLRKGSLDERACSKLLQSKINALLNRVAMSSPEDSILDRCASLPSDLKVELLWKSISRKSVTDAMLRCFLTTRVPSYDPKLTVKEEDHPSDFAKSLKHLSLCECQGITDVGLHTICVCCPSLQSLDLTGCRFITAFGLQNVIRSCSSLIELCLSGCPALCDKTIATVFRYNNPPHIRSLSVRRCDLHDYGLSTLASYCPTLQRLDIRSCGLITASGYYALIQRVPSITMLSCGRCIGTDDMALRHIGQGFGSSLTDINLEMCWRVTSKGVAELARCCTQLRSLNLSSCTLVDDTALKALAWNPYIQRSLLYVNLNECNVGDDALEELVANCSSLSYISVVGCPRITYQRAVRLAQLAGVQIIM